MGFSEKHCREIEALMGFMSPLTYKMFNLCFSIRCGTYNSHLH